MEAISLLIQRSPEFLKVEGHLIFEIGWGQKDRVLKLFDKNWDRVDTSQYVV